MRIEIKTAILFLLLQVFFFSASSHPVYAKKNTNKTNYLVIPVNYVTDRELTGETFGSHRRYPTHCQHHMYYGTAYVEVPNVNNKSDAELFKSLNWKVSEHGPSKIASKDRIDPSNPDASKKMFFDRLKASLDQSGKPELCLFVHGAADGFEDCAQDAALLAYSLQKPIVLYSWPSDPRRRGYFIDSNDVEWSQGHFDQLIRDLIALKAVHPLEVISVSHSMGNRLIVRSLPVVYGKGLVKDWELVSPDMDADTCRHSVMGYADDVHSMIRLYVSNKDKMLPLAQLLSGGYFRMGEAANPTYNADNVDTKLFQRIDFTDIDTGMTGHSIPFDLISNMVSTDKPGPNLELVDQTAVRGNRLARWAGKSEKYKETSEQANFSKKVVRTK